MSTPSADSEAETVVSDGGAVVRESRVTSRLGDGALAISGTQRLARLAVLLAAAISIWLLEATLLPSLPIPGAKFGFANIVTLLVIVEYGFSEATANVLLRVLAGSLLVGTLLSPAFVLAIAAGTMAACAMYGLYRWKGAGLSLVGVSVAGSVVHTAVQLLLAALLMGTWMVWVQGPVLLVVAIVTGCFNGLVAWHLVRRLGLGEATP